MIYYENEPFFILQKVSMKNMGKFSMIMLYCKDGMDIKATTQHKDICNNKN